MATIGIDIGGTKIAIGVLNGGHLIDVEQYPFHFFGDGEALAEFLAQRIGLLRRSFAVKGVGIGAPGWVRDGVIDEAINLGLDGLALARMLGDRVELPVLIENDARAALIGEWVQGALKGSLSAMMVTIGTGIGGALLLNGEPYRGSRMRSGEIGHVSINVNGALCACGKRGCLEMYASGAALVRAARVGLARAPLLHALCGGDAQMIDGGMLFEAAKAGDAEARRIIGCAVEALKHALFETAYLLDLDRIAIGGGLSVQREMLIEPLVEASRRPWLGVELRVAELGNLAGVIGAAHLPEGF